MTSSGTSGRDTATALRAALPQQRSASPDAELFASYAAAFPTPLLVVRLPGDAAGPRICWVNRAFVDLFGYELGEVLGQRLSVLERSMLVGSAHLGDGELDHLLRRRRAGQSMCSLEHKDGHRLLAEVDTVPVGPQHADSWFVSFAPSTQRLSADEQLRASEQRFRALADRAPVGIFSSDAGVRLSYVNDTFAEIFGSRAEALVGTAWLTRIHPDDLPDVLEAVEQLLRGDDVDLAVRVCPESGPQRWAELRAVAFQVPGQGAGFVGTLEDVTQRRAVDAYQRSHDPLTKLPNQLHLREKLAEHLADRAPDDPGLAVLVLGLDDFSVVNDALGHAAGDWMLVEVAHRLQAAAGEGFVARLTGDVFVVLCPGTREPAEAQAVAARLLAAVVTPLVLNDVELQVSASVGVVLDDGDSSVEGLLRDAGAARQQAKTGGRGRVALFDAQLREDGQHRLQLINDLRRAVNAEQLTVVYQPVVDLATSRLVSVEALVRWDHPTRGPISPDVFVRLAESHNLIGQLGAWVLDQACQQLRAWRDELGPAAPAYVAVNLSPVQLDDPALPRQVRQALERAGLAGRDLCLEVTESGLMSDAQVGLRSLAALRRLGAHLAIDDFGTGYSSFAHLNQLPVDLLKIDRSFIDRLGTEHSDAIVSSMVGLAKALTMTSVAEGVETAAQAAHLLGVGCRLGQGYHFSRPVPAERISRLTGHPLPLSAPEA